MNKILNIITAFSITCCAILTQSCTKSFDAINTDPDSPTTVTPGMLATDIILSHVTSAEGDEALFLEKRFFWGEQVEYYQYNQIGNGSFSGVMELTNAQKMVELASDNNIECYQGLYYYLKGYHFFRATMDMGDMPYSQALNSDEYLYPVYDTQEDVFIGILNDLELADEYFSKATTTFDGDPFYNGDPAKWRKATNSLRLKVLISLQLRAEDTPELDVKAKFAKIVSEGNIFTSIDDDLKVTYSEKDGQENPFNETFTRTIGIYAASKNMIDSLKSYNDYRLFHYYEPMAAVTDPLYLAAGQTLLEYNDWDAYEGIDVSSVFSDGSEKVASKMFCSPNDIYRLSYVGVPQIRMGYADQCFIIAEAAERGWISASAESYYNEGVRASFQFVKENIGDMEDPNATGSYDTYSHGMEITDEYLDTYLEGKGVKYDDIDTQEERLKKIWNQAYLASYFHLPYDNYYTYRRTGYPEFPINPETNLNDTRDKMPVRWLYPTSEQNYNLEQLNAALDRQWGGVEDVNKEMWVIKKSL